MNQPAKQKHVFSFVRKKCSFFRQMTETFQVFRPKAVHIRHDEPKYRNMVRFLFVFSKVFFIFTKKSHYSEIMTHQEIGNTIRERRKKMGINQQTLADLASVAVNTIVAIERGEGNPQLATLLTILDTLGLQMDIDIKHLDYETR